MQQARPSGLEPAQGAAAIPRDGERQKSDDFVTRQYETRRNRDAAAGNLVAMQREEAPPPRPPATRSDLHLWPELRENSPNLLIADDT